MLRLGTRGHSDHWQRAPRKSQIRNPNSEIVLHFPAAAVRPPGEAHSPLHAERTAGHVIAVVAQNERDAAGDLGGGSHPPPGKLLAADFELFFREELALARRVDPAGMEDVDADL